MSCSMVCKILFCSEFHDIPIGLAEKWEVVKEEEEDKQLQSVMSFTQTQLVFQRAKFVKRQMYSRSFWMWAASF